MALWVRAGLEVIFAVATSGDKGTPDKEMTNERLSRMREDEERAAAARLGVKEVVFMRFPDGELTPSLELRGAVTGLSGSISPTP